MARTLQTLICILIISLAACSSTPRRGTAKIEREPIRATSPEAQGRFDAAVEALEAGRYREASEEMRLLQAEFEGDPIAQVAELYIARASLADWEDSRGAAEALSIFSGLARSEDIDPRIRYAAMMYESATLATRGDSEAAFSSLAEYPGPSLSPAILKRDRAAAWSLLIEAHTRKGRDEEAIFAAGAAWDDDVPSTDSDSLRAFARQRAFEAARRLNDSLLEKLSVDPESALVRAAAGWSRVERLGDLEDASDEWMTRLGTDLVTVGENDRASALTARRIQEAPTGPIRIGVVLPMSGTNKVVGEKALRGAMLATGSLGEGNTSPASVVVVDAASSDADIIARLTAADVIGFVGPLDVNRAGSLADAATTRNIPMLALTTRMPELSRTDDANTWVFRGFLDADAEARAVARAAFNHSSARRVAIVRPDISYGERMATAFASEFEALGGEVVFQEAYDRKSSDYSRYAARVAKAKPDSVFVPDAAQKVAEVAAFLAAANIWGIPHTDQPSPKSKRLQVHYLGTSLWQAPILTQQSGSYVTGALIPVWSSPTFADQASATFHATYLEAYGAPATDLEAFTYDAVNTMIEASSVRGARTPAALRTSLLHGAHQGVTGEIRFRADGESVRDVRFVSIVEDAFVPLDLRVSSQPAKSVDPSL